MVINRLVWFLFWLLNRAFHLIAIFPFLKTINRLAGLILGVIEGILFVGVIAYAINVLVPGLPAIKTDLTASQTYVWLSHAAQFVQAHFPRLAALIMMRFGQAK